MFVLGKIWYDSTMLVIEAKLKGNQAQYSKLDEAIRTGQFIRNPSLRYWENNKGVTRNDLQKLCSGAYGIWSQKLFHRREKLTSGSRTETKRALSRLDELRTKNS